MVPGFRYHVITVVGIFMALTLGIIIGSSSVQAPIVDQTRKQLQALDTEFKSRIVKLEDQVRKSERFKEAVLSDTNLNGYRVALIQTGDYADATQKIRDALDQAGASISSETVISPTYPTRLDVVRASLRTKLPSVLPGTLKDKSGVIQLIADAIVKGGQDGDLAALEGAQLIRKSGDYSAAVSYVIVVGGATDESRVDTVDNPLAAELKTDGAKVVFAEPEQANISYIPALRGSELVTVDNADTIDGRVAVLKGLQAQTIGNFGVKATANGGILPKTRPQT